LNAHPPDEYPDDRFRAFPPGIRCGRAMKPDTAATVRAINEKISSKNERRSPDYSDISVLFIDK
jgi:hypothetical protein